MDFVALPISVLSLVVSIGTFWFVFLHRGRLAMTTPTHVYFGYDFVPWACPKIHLRTLLYSTSKRGQFIEAMYARVRRNNQQWMFEVWGYGESGDFSRGSGLYIGPDGLTANHHFLQSKLREDFQFEAGKYEIDIMVSIVGRRRPTRLATITLPLSGSEAATLMEHRGVDFELTIDGTYNGHPRIGD
ncbi:hypothetical protein [Hoeflea prorocentri]|uniref:Uncharacterized protein n=1 Tax=Hoeflea prorocentri TaxID=1922333 RepID=A0A9X3UGW2_9HYPH|nr:hypothetical protein [Hoeflea prorocentri]MCY6380603.1 hypothetical protein [Hoeflea prorocentri]MDA5398403.1 hypothetical protein [Hoeflea prorocentri]